METEVISPWTIYWIMQLDSIKEFATATFLASLAFVIVLNVARGPVWCEGSEEGMRFINKWTFRAVPVALVFGLISTLIPSSKTAAAIVLIPAIANNETVQKEAGELYQLAKEGLRELVKPDDKK